VHAAKLDPIFLCAGPFTVVPPSNAAFADNPGLTTYLTDPANLDELREVLLYHILPGLYLSDDFEEGPIETIGLSPLTLNGVQVVETDVMACNGVLHIIDHVLVPPGT